MPLRITLVFRDDPHSMNHFGDVAEDRKLDVIQNCFSDPMILQTREEQGFANFGEFTFQVLR